MQVHEMMTPPEACVGVDTPINEAVAAMRMKHVDYVCVVDHAACTGILTDAEITAQLAQPGFDPTVITAGEVVSEQDRFQAIVDDHDAIRQIPEHMELDDALRLMADRDLEHLAVHDTQNTLVGVLSRGELTEAAISLQG